MSYIDSGTLSCIRTLALPRQQGGDQSGAYLKFECNFVGSQIGILLWPIDPNDGCTGALEQDPELSPITGDTNDISPGQCIDLSGPNCPSSGMRVTCEWNGWMYVIIVAAVLVGTVIVVGCLAYFCCRDRIPGCRAMPLRSLLAVSNMFSPCS